MILSKLTAARLAAARLAVRQGRWSSTEAGHEPNPDLWRRIFYFGCCPAIVLAMINTYLEEKEHWEHYKRPEFKPYEYLRIRTKKYPWGDGNHGLFHNPLVNPLPDGWEPLPPDQAARYDPPDIILSPTALRAQKKKQEAEAEA